MKDFNDSAAELVHRITEQIEDEEDFGNELKDVTGEDEDVWFQIDGDANPWVWGGSWLNPVKNEIIHFEGIDNDGIHEVEPEEVKVPESVLAKVNSRIHDPYLDTEEAGEDPEWLRRMLFREEMERDRLLDQYRIARAEFLNNRKPHPFWRIMGTDHLPPWWQKYEEHSPTGMSDEDWQTMPAANKIIELARYFGLNEVGHSFNWTHHEAAAFLGANNI